MRTFKQLLTVAATATALMAGAGVQAKDNNADIFSSFKKMDQKASFIHGEGLIQNQLYVYDDIRNKSDKPLTLVERARALDTVMVSRDGTQYTAKMDPKDLAIFEKAVANLKALGLDSRVFETKGQLPVSDENSNCVTPKSELV